MKRGFPILVAFATMAAAAAPVYRTTDAAGYVVLSDRPLPGARPVSPRRVNTHAPPVAEPGRPPGQATTAAAEPRRYESLEIVFPEAGATVRANGGNVRIEGRLVPDLAAGHRLAVSVDGHIAACTPRDEGRFVCTLSAVARGPHTVRVDVLDESGAVVTRTGATHFHVLRASVARRVPIARHRGMH